MIKNYVKHSTISLPTNYKVKPNLTRLMRLVEMKKAYDNPTVRYRRAHQHLQLHQVCIWNSDAVQPDATFRRLSVNEAGYRLIRVRQNRLTIN